MRDSGRDGHSQRNKRTRRGRPDDAKKRRRVHTADPNSTGPRNKRSRRELPSPPATATSSRPSKSKPTELTPHDPACNSRKQIKTRSTAKPSRPAPISRQKMDDSRRESMATRASSTRHERGTRTAKGPQVPISPVTTRARAPMEKGQSANKPGRHTRSAPSQPLSRLYHADDLSSRRARPTGPPSPCDVRRRTSLVTTGGARVMPHPQ